jgi:hypothetical protein
VSEQAGLGRFVSLIAAVLTVLILADQLLDGRIRRALELALDGRPRARPAWESFTPGAEHVIRRAEEITREEGDRNDH